jgi:hypothetical protein
MLSTWKGLRTRRADADAAVRVGQPGRAPELLWAALPVVALILVFVGTWQTITRVANSDAPGPYEQEPSFVSGSPTLLARYELPLGTVTVTATRIDKKAAPVLVDSEPVMVESADPQEYRPQ